MLLVLLIHFVSSFPVTNASLTEQPLKSILFTELHSISVVCVNCFILISGYFGINWKIKSFTSLLYQVLFWLIIGYLVAKYVFGVESHEFVKMAPLYFSLRWFVPAYIALYILSPLLNSFIKASETKTLALYILVFYAYSTVVGYLLRSSEFNEGMSAISLVGLYMIGALLHRSDIRLFSFSMWTDLAIYILMSLFLSIVALGLNYIGIDKSPFGYLNPIVIIMSVYLFLFFKKLNIGEVKFINKLAASAFAVYLFHYHPDLAGHYNQFCKIIANQGIITIIWAPLFFLTIFGLSVIIDQARIYSFRGLHKVNKLIRNNESVACS